jgi:hypothetical protein
VPIIKGFGFCATNRAPTRTASAGLSAVETEGYAFSSASNAERRRAWVRKRMPDQDICATSDAIGAAPGQARAGLTVLS